MTDRLRLSLNPFQMKIHVEESALQRVEEKAHQPVNRDIADYV